MTEAEAVTACHIAADLIERVGHAKKTYRLRDGNGDVVGYCALGAVATARGVRDAMRTQDEARVARAIGFSTVGHLTDWNDDDATTQADVVAKLRGVQ